jgi:hypothetical protein
MMNLEEALAKLSDLVNDDPNYKGLSVNLRYNFKTVFYFKLGGKYNGLYW